VPRCPPYLDDTALMPRHDRAIHNVVGHERREANSLSVVGLKVHFHGRPHDTRHNVTRRGDIDKSVTTYQSSGRLHAVGRRPGGRIETRFTQRRRSVRYRTSPPFGVRSRRGQMGRCRSMRCPIDCEPSRRLWSRQGARRYCGVDLLLPPPPDVSCNTQLVNA
jgi:hypothetical protein